MRVLTDYPQEAWLLAIDFEETNGYQAEQLEEQEKQYGPASGTSGARRGAGRIHSNVGTPGEFEPEETIGGDDEVDWKDADD